MRSLPRPRIFTKAWRFSTENKERDEANRYLRTGRWADFPIHPGCGGLQCTEPASLVLPFRFELVQVAA
jgi:hypothetical protein